MSSCFVFSGTSEGREVVERLADIGVKCSVFVATEYGNAVMKPHQSIDVNVGRLTSEEIAELITKGSPDFVIDATHPHAEIITENIKAACEISGMMDNYIRVNRYSEKNGFTEENIDYLDTVRFVSSVEDALNLLKDEKGESVYSSGNIFLTTGVKELHSFCVDGIKKRLVARILPSIESLEEAYRCGLDTKSVVAMEGPFSEEMNIALIHQYDIKVLITKNSGTRGGFAEKINACRNCGIKAIVISKEEKADVGKTIDETVEFVSTRLNLIRKKLSIIGTGICKEEYLTTKALSLIKNADVIIGAKRMAEFGSQLNKTAEIFTEYYSDKIIQIIDDSTKHNHAVLFSGDISLCSGARKLNDIVKNRDDLEVEMVPGISSVSYFASRIGIQYSDYPFISLHENEGDYVSLVEKYGGFIAICSGVKDVINVTKNVLSMPSKKTLLYGYNLGTDEEKFSVIDNEEDTADLNEGLYVLAVIDSKKN